MKGSRAMAMIASISLGAVAACSAATPSTQGSATVEPSVLAKPKPTAGGSTRPSPVAADPALVDLGEFLDIGSIDVEFSSRVLEFASTGPAIIASAGAPGEKVAPDLYEILPRSGQPRLLWRNPERDHSLVKMAGDGDTIAFVDMPVTGEAGWTLLLIPEEGQDPIVLDQHGGDPAVSSLVPSFAVYWPYVTWTAFGAGRDGPVSRLLYAESPDWEPLVLAERPAEEAEFWFPSLLGARLVVTELVYVDDRASDERRVWLADLKDFGNAQRLDESGRATMPLVNQYGIHWKEADPGFHQLNWGTMHRYDADAGRAEPMPTGGQEYVNYPSTGTRYLTWWGADATRLDVWDGARGVARGVLAYDSADQRILRPHVGGSLMAWLFVDDSVEPALAEIRYAWLP